MKFLRSTFLTALLALIGGAVYAGCTARASYTQNGSTVTFYNDSSTSVSGNHTLTWHFGDRTTGSGSQVYHAYNSFGTYNACLVIYDSASQCADSTCFTITISNNNGGNNCNASFTSNVDSANSLKYYFSGSAPSSGGSAEWAIYDNGNKIYKGQNAMHTFSAAGTYDVSYSLLDSLGDSCSHKVQTITVVNNNNGGGNNCNATFTYNVGVDGLKYYFTGSAPSVVGSASWEVIENGIVTNYNGQNATHTFSASGTYRVHYTLKDSLGRMCDSIGQLITVVKSAPTCKASYYVALDSNNKFGLYLVNNSTGTNNNTQYSWDFGDGTTSNAQYPTHQYANFGIYMVCLTISDLNSNCYSTHCDTIGMDSNGSILKLNGFGITVIDEAMLGVEEQTTSFAGVNVYPNPSTGKFTFTIDSKKGAKMSMRVMNSMGQQVAQNETYLTTGSNKIQLDLSSLSDGLYFVNLRAGDEVKSVRLYLAR
jgi:PKD repeat protein